MKRSLFWTMAAVLILGACSSTAARFDEDAFDSVLHL